MQVDAGLVIEKLLKRIGELERQQAVLQVLYEQQLQVGTQMRQRIEHLEHLEKQEEVSGVDVQETAGT